MSTKAAVVSELGEHDLLVPSLVHGALAANERAKFFFSLIQLAKSHADTAEEFVPDLRSDRELAGIDDPRFDDVIAHARRDRADDYRVPLAKTIVDAAFHDTESMLAPLRAASPSRVDEVEVRSFDERLEALRDRCELRTESTLTGDEVEALTSSDRAHADSLHLLVLDLHKAVDKLEASLATEDIDGAKVHGLHERDRVLVGAFMRGIHETEAVKFGHPGLGTMATRRGQTLVLENDLGETAAHVVVIHVDGLRVAITSTDVHLQRLEFLERLLARFPMHWDDVASRSARTIPHAEVFFQHTGIYEAPSSEELERFLTFLGSRLVYLIDWNRARKAIRSFVSKAATIEILDRAASEGWGHRGLLEAGGKPWVFDIVGDVVRIPLRFGERLDDILGAEQAAEFLRTTLRTCSEGLHAWRPPSSLRAELGAELARLVRSRGERLLEPVTDHARLVLTLARTVHELLGRNSPVPDARAADAVRAAKDVEHRADALVMDVRSVVERIPSEERCLRLIEHADDAADALEEAVFRWSLLPATTGELAAETRGTSLVELADLVVAAAEGWLACVTTAQHASPDGRTFEVRGVVDAVDGILVLERRMDEAERRATTRLAADARATGKFFALVSRVTAELERAVDSLMRASLVLRDRVVTSMA
ncbi:hypothetical protein AKJ09_06240 [Labilithrix luteola]|uniref:DUF47 family protein n=1 Tax=Labilithrix luteola TaxID=1391654 RepID=A0A0K1Q1Q2_9BACT|nr:hypothetical protein [Labilithrix luteola]AKU99576.1 hypothetical protein AKJ09_06240 [Labilithrix luteola]